MNRYRGVCAGAAGNLFVLSRLLSVTAAEIRCPEQVRRVGIVQRTGQW